MAVFKKNNNFWIDYYAYGKSFGDIKKSFFTAMDKAGIIDFHFHAITL